MPFTQPWLEANFGTAYAGLVGTVGYRLYQNDDSDSIARTTASIVEIGTNTGCYGVVPPSIPDNAVGIEWDTGGGSPVSATEDLEPYRRRAVVEGKLPTNYIMGSGVQTDKDDEIDDILADTAAIQPLVDQSLSATESNIRGADGDDLKDISDQIDTIDTDTSAIVAKLPTNYIMGSSDQTDKDDDIDAILVDTADMQPKLGTPAVDISADIAAVPTVGEIDTELSSTHGPGDWEGTPILVKQSFSYDQSAATMRGLIWVEMENTVSAKCTAVVVALYDVDGTLVGTFTPTGPDARNLYKLVLASPTIVRGQSYYAYATATITGFGDVESAKGAFTFGA